MSFLSAMQRSLLLSLGLTCISHLVIADETAQPEIRFDIWEFQVEGATLLQRSTIENTVYPYLGSNKSLSDVESARRSLEQSYRDAGFAAVLVNIPEQEANDGVIRLKVVESRIERLRVSGTRYFSPRDLRAGIPALQQGESLHLPTLQAQLAEAARIAPDRVLNPVFRPGIEPGTMEAELNVEDKVPLHGSLALNDRYVNGTSRLRLDAALSYANMWQRYHTLSLNYQASPQEWDDTRVWSLGYTIPVESSRWSLSAIHSSSNAAALGALGVVSNGDIYGISWQHSLEGRSGLNHGISLTLQYKDQVQSVVVDPQKTDTTPISYSVAQMQYNRLALDELGSTRLSLGTSLGLRLLGNGDHEFNNKRFNSKANFIHLNGEVERIHAGFRNTTLRLRLAAQLSDSPLISSEQMSAGGADTVRGYTESIAMGDDGLLTNIELRSPPLIDRDGSSLYDLQLLAFADGALLRRHDTLPSESPRQHLAGVGVGARLAVGKSLNALLDLASPLVDAGSTSRGDARVHFNLGYQF